MEDTAASEACSTGELARTLTAAGRKVATACAVFGRVVPHETSLIFLLENDHLRVARHKGLTERRPELTLASSISIVLSRTSLRDPR
jgi:hypothetical protein